MITVSRSAVSFLRRHGYYATPRAAPVQLDLDQLAWSVTPLAPSQVNPALVLNVEGDPPPDRGRIDVWPPPPKVQ